jgi:hypothetical protein
MFMSFGRRTIGIESINAVEMERHKVLYLLLGRICPHLTPAKPTYM